MLQHPEPLSSQQMQHHSGTGVWLRLVLCKLRNSHARQQVHWQGTSETGMCFFRAVLGQGRWRQTGGQGLSCLWAGWRARLQSLPPGLDILDYNVHKVPALSALGLGSRKLCLALRVYFTLLHAEEQASDFLRLTQVAGGCPLLTREQLGCRAHLLLMHHHLPLALFPDT